MEKIVISTEEQADAFNKELYKMIQEKLDTVDTSDTAYTYIGWLCITTAWKDTDIIGWYMHRISEWWSKIHGLASILTILESLNKEYDFILKIKNKLTWKK